MFTTPRALIALNLALLAGTLAVLASTARPKAAAGLGLAWQRQEAPLSPTWPDQPRFTSDGARKPVLAGTVVLLTSSRDDTLTAISRTTGNVRWRFTANGPIRFAPAVWDGKAYVASDDGHLYCLSLDDGSVVWSFQGAPGNQLVLGNERLISTWPARGAPVIADDGENATVYFAAGIWPFMGIFLHALDARNGEVRWVNSGDGSTYMKQPHTTDAFAGIAPQGQLVVSGRFLLVAGGRSIPAAYNRDTGERIHYRLAESSKLGGGPDIVACADVYVNGGAGFDLSTGKFLGPSGESACAEGGILYSVKSGSLRAFNLSRRPPPTKDVKPAKGKAAKPRAPSEAWMGPPISSLPLKGITALTVNEGRVHAGVPGRVYAIDGMSDGKPVIVWQAGIQGTPAHLAADGSTLTVSTREGSILHFAPEDGPTRRYRYERSPLPTATEAEAALARRWLEWAKAKSGYAVVANPTPGLAAELIKQSELRLIFLHADKEKAAALREDLRKANIDGKRAAVLPLTAANAQLPPYLCNLLAVADDEGLEGNPNLLDRLATALRPFGGVACLPPGLVSSSTVSTWRAKSTVVGLPNTEERDGWLLLRRNGALPGSADWTHQNADAANTRVSKDDLVKAPLGLLWFGGPGNQDILPRHGHGPVPQVVGGRLMIEGMDALRAIDIYTGRLLWQTNLPGLGRAYDNVAHQAGANATGGNYVSMEHGVYVLLGRQCLRLDVDTGRIVQKYELPRMPREGEAPEWTFLAVEGDFLIGAARSTRGGKRKKGEFFGLEASGRVTVLNRHTGKALWSETALHGFRHNGIVAGPGKLFVLDREADPTGKLAKAGAGSLKGRVAAFELRSGKRLWEVTENVFGTWLGYSDDHGVLAEAGLMTRDTLRDEAKGIRVYRVSDGAVLWHRPDYFGPALLHGERLLKGGDDRGGSGTACNILTGRPEPVRDPLTGEMIPWRWERTYGCNTPAASRHLMLFRSGAAGFYDITGDGGTGNLGGFRSSCTLNLIPAGGVLTAPDYTRTCTCSYQNQTSVAFVHMPELEWWSFTSARPVQGVVRRVGINLGAPGSRRSEDGTLWLEYPKAGGPSPKLTITTVPTKLETFRMHSSQVVSGSPAWVIASGVRDLRQLKVSLGGDAKARRRYTVLLYFLEPDGKQPGERVFDVSIQGKKLITALDVSAEARGPMRGRMREVRGIEAGPELVLAFTPGAILSGVEVIAEGW